MSIVQIHPADFADFTRAQVAQGHAVILLDVREAWENERASVRPENAVFLHIPMQEIPERIAQIQAAAPAGALIACLCHHGVRSLRVAHFLVAQGMSGVHNISGGIAAWSDCDANIARY